MQQIVPRISRIPLAVRRLNMIVPVQKTLMVARLDGADYALLDSGSGLASCPISFADDLPLCREHPTCSVECIGQRQVGSRLENGEPFVVMWHVENVTNFIISSESLTGANIEVRHAKNESSMIMDRSGTRTSVVLHKFAKVLWLKLRRDNSVLDSDLSITALGTRPMAFEAMDSEEEIPTRLRKKKRTLGVGETMEGSHRFECSGGGTRLLTRSFPKPVQLLRASQSRRRSTTQTTKRRTRVPDHHGGKELCTILDMLDVVLGMMAAICMEEKGPAA